MCVCVAAGGDGFGNGNGGVPTDVEDEIEGDEAAAVEHAAQ